MVHVFILNPETGKENFGEKLRAQLELIPNITYYVFDTRYAGEEQGLVKRIINLFDDEDIRIYCCGGSGTLRNIIDGVEKPENVEIAFYPIGMTNDYLKCFGEDASRFLDLIGLIEGDAVSVDYITTNYGKSLNAISLGIDEEMITTINKVRQWNVLLNQFPYFWGMVHSFVRLKAVKYIVEIDDIEMKVVASEIAIGNGCFLAGKIRYAAHSDLVGGLANYIIAASKSKIKLINILYQTTHERLEKIYPKVFYGKCKKMKIMRGDHKPFQASFDGELVTISDILEVNVIPRTLKFVIPKGVSLP